MTFDNLSRVAVFVDGSNLYFAVRDGLHRQDIIDVERLAKKLIKGRQLVRIYYYHVPRLEGEPEAARRHQAFLNRLGYVDYLQLRLGRIVPRLLKLRCQSCDKDIEHITHIQKGVDTRIVIDMVGLALLDAYDVAILVSGDADLAEAVNFIKEHTRKYVENAYIMWQGWAKNLREAADVRICLTEEFLSDCWVQRDEGE
ncbi:MAG: NYN domain-containing protein [Dehalococcoidales bacterium]|nr:NYN domain-containing protein [Dehalococcoidales bacterium]